ncbi:UNVERIFIED_CONTAM: hypothetical protein PYX00_007396 [Menopon gallinae]|uniref:Uncharacterized protein n=1 Tax=Menopon gallinae TaxID=328185 RepID=A0AAW2HJ22_9NEOP
MINILAFLWISLTVFEANGSNLLSSCQHSQEESRELSPRGYGYGYPFLPFLEPLSILAVIAFLAFLVQTFHAIYHNHHANHGLGGGLLNNVLPSHHKKMQSESRHNDNIFRAIEFYEAMNRRRQGKKRSKNSSKSKRKSTT